MCRSKLLQCGLILAMTCGVAAAVEPREIAVGEWSRPVSDNRGYAVRGRLVLAERRFDDERREVAVYVDLQDASEHVGGAMRIFCDLGKHDFSESSRTGLRCQMKDADGRDVPSTPFPFGGVTPKSIWVELPSDATIRLRASPFGISRPGAMAITPSLDRLWVIQAEDSQEYSLRGTFTVDPDEGRKTVHDPQIWRGTLELPALKFKWRK